MCFGQELSLTVPERLALFPGLSILIRAINKTFCGGGFFGGGIWFFCVLSFLWTMNNQLMDTYPCSHSSADISWGCST